MKISLVASSIRPNLWSEFCNSLTGTQVPYEVIFVGDHHMAVPPKNVVPIISKVKPSQCYEIGFRKATGTLIHWTADDAEYEPGALDKMAEIWKQTRNPKAILAFRTIEDGKDCTPWHHLIGGRKETPVMAPFGVMDAQFLKDLGGYDRRYICGQSENDLVMRALYEGAQVIQTPIKVYVEHSRKHGGGKSVFRAGPNGNYSHDRKILEASWLLGEMVSPVRLDAFEPFFDEGIMDISQSYKGKWE